METNTEKLQGLLDFVDCTTSLWDGLEARLRRTKNIPQSKYYDLFQTLMAMKDSLRVMRERVIDRMKGMPPDADSTTLNITNQLLLAYRELEAIQKTMGNVADDLDRVNPDMS